MLNKLFSVVLALALLFLTGDRILASDYQFTAAASRKAGVIAKVLERANLIFKFSGLDRARYWQKLLDIRLAELKMEVDDENFDLVEETASRYSTYLGRYAEFVIGKKIIDQKETILDQLKVHSEVLSKLRDGFEYDSAWWLMIQHDVNTIQIFKERIEKEL